MSQHTPTPYHFNSASGNLCQGNGMPSIYGIKVIAHINSTNDAAFIVRACNSHAALVAALQTVSAHYSGSLDSQPPYLAAVRDALAHTAQGDV